MKRIFVFCLGVFLIFLNAQKNSHNLEVVNYDELKEILYKNDNRLYVVNFWATWCKPCVEELPDFMKVNEEYKSNPNYQMILVSLDFAKQKDKKVIPFLQKYKIENDVYILDDNKRMNEWIPAFDEGWSGSIPATILIKNGESKFFIENTLKRDQLIQTIEQNLEK